MQSFARGAQVLIVGASRGIGLEFVRQALAGERAGRIFAGCRRPAAAGALRALAAARPERLRALAMDVTDEASLAAAAAEIGRHGERLHLLVNCAGLLHDGELQPEKRLSEVDAGALARSFAVNASGPLLVAKHCERFFRHRDRAVLANISARVGSIGDNRLGGWYGYRAAKAAQNMFTRTLAVEFARSHRSTICVALHPGTTDTALSRPFQGGVPADRLFPVERTVRQLFQVIDGLTPDDSGDFFAWDGRRIPW